MKNNKRGSTSVFLSLILITIIGLAGAFIYHTKQMTGRSCGDGAVQLAGRSILSEFDLDLKREYGLLAFYGWGEETVRKAEGYLEPTLQKEKDLKIRELSVSFSDYNLQDPKRCKEQIVDYMKTVPEALLKKKETGITTGTMQGEKEDRVLRNQKIISSLPSTALGKSPTAFSDRIKGLKDKVLSLDTLMQKGTEHNLVGAYILFQFNNRIEQERGKHTFFTSEIEYILEGEYDEQKNQKAVERDLLVLRSILNGAYLYQDPAKRSMIMAAAQALTPGATAVITQAAITTAWSLAEAENDVDLLMKGKKVPFRKNEASWATDLDAVIKNIGQKTMDPGNADGMVYRDYLRCLLFLQEESLQLVRVMDLIQINMQGNYNGSFRISDYNTGMRLEAQINGRRYQYETQY